MAHRLLLISMGMGYGMAIGFLAMGASTRAAAIPFAIGAACNGTEIWLPSDRQGDTERDSEGSEPVTADRDRAAG